MIIFTDNIFFEQAVILKTKKYRLCHLFNRSFNTVFDSGSKNLKNFKKGQDFFLKKNKK